MSIYIYTYCMYIYIYIHTVMIYHDISQFSHSIFKFLWLTPDVSSEPHLSLVVRHAVPGYVEASFEGGFYVGKTMP